MDRAACPHRAIEGLRGQWQQRALLLGLEDEPGDLAGGAMHTGARQIPTPDRRARLHVGEVEEVLPAEEVLADVGDSALPLSVSRWRGTAESTTKPRYCAYSRKTRAIAGA